MISVDTKKKKLVGDFKAVGRELRPKGSPIPVCVHDFKDPEFGNASILSWWQHLGRARYPTATTPTITADCGGSNCNRTRLWKTELQELAHQTGLEISVCHLPPGASTWNKIEHRLFSFISKNWRGKPLTSLEVIVNLIGPATREPATRSTPNSTSAPTRRGSKSATPN